MALNKSNTTTTEFNSMSDGFSGLNGILKFNESLAQYTSWNIGGNARIYYRPKNLPDLINFLKQVSVDEEILFLGLGSNVLIRDGGFPGVVVHLFKTVDYIEIVNQDNKLAGNLVNKSNANNDINNNADNNANNNVDNNYNLDNNSDLLIRVGAGVTCAKIAKFCTKNNLIGGEFFAGIPGTMGGALAMNAGAFGSETWNYVVAVDLVTDSGEILTRNKLEFVVKYRSVVNNAAHEAANKSPNKSVNNGDNKFVKEISSSKSRPAREWFIGGYLKFSRVNTIKSVNTAIHTNEDSNGSPTIKSLLKQRSLTQPIGLLSCGSVFKNPNGLYAAKLIEAAKLKGIRVGNAEVSTKHANFIINLGNAKAQDVEDLMELVALKVWQTSKVKLEPEVKIIGIK